MRVFINSLKTKIMILRRILIALVLFCQLTVQSQDPVEVLNQVVADLMGEHKNPSIPTFNSMADACNSPYIDCNKRKTKIEGLFFQFANLNGFIPSEIAELKNLKYINLEFNYLKGIIPQGLTKLNHLQRLNLRGNFLTGPLPDDIGKMNADVDLSENSIKTDNKKAIRKYRIQKQINLEECRSPDSIFISKKPIGLLGAVTPNKPDPQSEPTDNSSESNLAATAVESMPRFPGCEDPSMDNAQREECAKMEMLQFIYRNLKYPILARENGVEGMVVIQFIINDVGDIEGANVVRDVGGNCGNAALWIVNRMNYICDPWIPGTQRGKAVKVLYTLPIKFKLEG